MYPRAFGLTVLLITAFLVTWLQVCGWRENHATTDIAVSDGTGRSYARETYRVNYHQVDWAHGWPLCYLIRHTRFHIEFPDGTLDPTYDPMDERSWAVHRGASWFNGLHLLTNIIICLIIALAIAMIVANAKGRLLRAQRIRIIEK